jgi:hypothetical protein
MPQFLMMKRRSWKCSVLGSRLDLSLWYRRGDKRTEDAETDA